MAAENETFEMDDDLKDVPDDPMTEGDDGDGPMTEGDDGDGEGFSMADFDDAMPGEAMDASAEAADTDGPAFDAPSFEDEPNENDFVDEDEEEDDFGEIETEEIVAHEDEGPVDEFEASDENGPDDGHEDEPSEDDDVDPALIAKKPSAFARFGFPLVVLAFLGVGGYGGYTFLAPVMGWDTQATSDAPVAEAFTPSALDAPETPGAAMPFETAGTDALPGLPPLDDPSGGPETPSVLPPLGGGTETATVDANTTRRSCARSSPRTGC